MWGDSVGTYIGHKPELIKTGPVHLHTSHWNCSFAKFAPRIHRRIKCRLSHTRHWRDINDASILPSSSPYTLSSSSSRVSSSADQDIVNGTQVQVRLLRNWLKVTLADKFACGCFAALCVIIIRASSQLPTCHDPFILSLPGSSDLSNSCYGANTRQRCTLNTTRQT
jgi:hypothetical protein